MMILSTCLTTAGQLDEAVRYGRLAVERDPESFVARWSLALALSSAGLLDESREILEGAAAISGRHHLALQGLAVTLARVGQREAADTLYRELAERHSRGELSDGALVVAAEAAGHRDRAIAHAVRAWAERDPSFTLFARHSPELKSLHSDPRFCAIIAEMNA